MEVEEVEDVVVVEDTTTTVIKVVDVVVLLHAPTLVNTAGPMVLALTLALLATLPVTVTELRQLLQT